MKLRFNSFHPIFFLYAIPICMLMYGCENNTRYGDKTPSEKKETQKRLYRQLPDNAYNIDVLDNRHVTFDMYCIGRTRHFMLSTGIPGENGTSISITELGQ